MAEFLARHALEYRLVRVDAGEPLPLSIDEYDGFVFMGGPMSVNDDLPWIPRALDLIRAAVAVDKPVLGHCLGGQLISKALGGQVTRNAVAEIGWLPVRTVDCPSAREWFDGCGSEFEVFHWHGETFSIPAGATHILQSRDCAHQGFARANTLALQCHIEMTADMVNAWALNGADETANVCATVQSAHQMTDNLHARVRALNAIADRIYTRWIAGLR